MFYVHTCSGVLPHRPLQRLLAFEEDALLQNIRGDDHFVYKWVSEIKSNG